jgi:hypothetical protein
VAPLLLALCFAESDAARGWARLHAAVRKSALPVAAVGLVLLVRTVVLGGIGGHPGSSLLAGAGRGLAIGPLYTLLLLMPQPVVRDFTLARGLVAAGATALVAGLGARQQVHPRRLLPSAASGALLPTTASGEIASWYASPSCRF